jgi:hypothetical protein
VKGVGAPQMDAEGTGVESEEGPVKGVHCEASATGDDDGSGMDCATFADGHSEHSGEHAAVGQ